MLGAHRIGTQILDHGPRGPVAIDDGLEVTTWIFATPPGQAPVYVWWASNHAHPLRVAAGFVAAVLGGFVWFSQPLKPVLARWVGGFPFFSRLDAPRALQHPMRQRILALVRQEPGVHFQEIARRLNAPQGTLVHHLAKLVQLDVLVIGRTNGFACYFVKGEIDRRVMAALPALKSEGARRLVELLPAQPGMSAVDLALAAGLDKGTVSYHLKRLQRAYVVELQRQGCYARATLTPHGSQAARTQAGASALPARD